MTNRRGFGVGLALAALVVAMLVGGAVWATAPPEGERADLHDLIASRAAGAGDGGTLQLADVTDFAWDQLHVFDAYAGSQDIERQLGGWSPLSPAGRVVWGDLFLAQDGLQLLAFVRSDEVVAWTILNGVNLDRPTDQATWLRIETEDQHARFDRASTFRVTAAEGGGWTLLPV